MKKVILMTVLVVGGFVVNTVNAQTNVCVFCASNVDIQPGWGPAGYDYADYYFIPDIDVYYNVNEHQFIYLKKGVWISSAKLPAKYATFDLYKAHKVVFNEEEPYMQNTIIKIQYASLKGQHDQLPIRDSRAAKYAKVKSTKNMALQASGN